MIPQEKKVDEELELHEFNKEQIIIKLIKKLIMIYVVK